jgi:Lsr2
LPAGSRQVSLYGGRGRRVWGYGAVDNLRWCAGADAGTERTVAQKIQTLFIDDLDGSPAEGTVRFALDGTSYEIDLSGEHAQALRGALSRYIGAARRAPGTQRPARSRRRKPSAGDPDSTEVRDWARSQGIDVKDRGRIPAGLVVKFKAATTQ